MSELKLSVRIQPLTCWSAIWPQLQGFSEKLPKIEHLTADSRRVKAGSVFFALQGVTQSGMDYLQVARDKGASLLVNQGPLALTRLQADTWQLTLPDLQKHLGQLLAVSTGRDYAALNTTAITGTNGKSSVAHFLAQLRQQLGQKVALVGTLGYGPLDALQPASHTTPDLLRMHQLYQDWMDQGIEQVCLEASSHALDQGRLDALPISTGVLTNLTRDHLDYHQTLEAYAAAKSRLFSRPELQTRVINLDDALLGEKLVASSSVAKTLTFSLKKPEADLFLAHYTYSDQGFEASLVWQQQSYVLHLPLLGRFNLANVLAALAVLLSEGHSLEQLLPALTQLQPVTGRMEQLRFPETAASRTLPRVVVDYAHTPDALEQALASLRPHTQGLLFCVFGCGGDRDQGKRPLMAKVAREGADRLVITDDNPRNEDPAQIRQQLLSEAPDAKEIADRKEALSWALTEAKAGDLVLIAGKGHEDYQEIAGQRLPFSDQEVARTLLQERLKS
ncbi:UDP-N-acetylmuramoylalanyl-D-glutamate--2,6-diaminopimelate ligase [Marinospirillum celere]|uniref:UDP-N-acetylmuramoyl-L-alanyl-D-glutamate--2,6-diaminopimelate ligase n=1 Tax=Marinospirillum celere TaxID=1122252 RepID=A0A1I1FYQ4_9GAMM|nr:UDP-N-acetylmuramoyl-L-alanyl-D-glutamate--2,6-diaminopimelate ligase [Marinospirillum celere]SFC04494.1 UDP-N-acetylmuramoylalanyl-D-glutamate--2,6-diaminopimelate ligase [Marinospirillum celere]